MGMTMLRRLATVTTFAGLIGAFGASLTWMLVADGPARLQPTAQALALVAALTGIVAERYAAQQQRRRQALTTLTGELLANRAILDEMLSVLGGPHAVRRRVYPRLLVSATDGTIAFGALTGDADLLARLHDWRNQVLDFNRRLDLTEMLTFLQGTPEEIHSFGLALSREDGRVRRISQLLNDVLDFLDQKHEAVVVGVEDVGGVADAVAGAYAAGLVSVDAHQISPGLPAGRTGRRSRCRTP